MVIDFIKYLPTIIGSAVVVLILGANIYLTYLIAGPERSDDEQ